ncbi:MAG: 2,3-bisphosphoglycerate-independent phosphoglycerate mutase [bacterium]
MPRPVVLIVRDGWGIGRPDDPGNAVAAAQTPVMEHLLSTYPHTVLGCAGEDVGLVQGSQGSSEVGHLNMGAGRIVEQEVVRIDKLIRDGSFFKNPKLLGAIENCKRNNSRLHLMGLVQDQGVHAMDSHLYALLELARQHDLKRTYVHFFSDGRDTPPRSALTYLKRLEAKMAEIGIGKVASVMGRYYAMDRDRNWERTRAAYEALTEGKGFFAPSATAAIEAAYRRADEMIREAHLSGREIEGVIETDEFIKPTLIMGSDGKPVALIENGDSVIFFNYRQDRAVQLTMAFVEPTFDKPGFRRSHRLEIYFIGLTRYYDTFENHVIPPMNMSNILGEVISANGLWQLRISETQKFRHVTSFFNSKKEEPFPGEDRILVNSPKVPEDQKPEMSAFEVAELTVNAIREGIESARELAKRTPHVTLYQAPPLPSPDERFRETYDLIIVNFVNCDMVGHTGVFEAAVKAVETVDKCVGMVVDAALEVDGIALVTSDHGNAEQMIDPETGKPQTAHTTNDVDFVLVGNGLKGKKLRERGILSDIAPTILEVLGIPAPPEMTARSLIAE